MTVRARLGLVLALAACPGCQQERFTQAGAEREVQGLLAARRGCVPEVQGGFAIEGPACRAQQARRPVERVLDLRAALQLATRASRDYLRQREAVYLAALDVTGERNAFRNQYGLGGSLGVPFDGEGFDLEAGAGASVSRQLTTGGSILIDIASNALRNLTGDPLSIAQSILSVDIVIPLGRGSGRLVAMEPLRQSERDLLYALRDFARFQQTFTVQIATSYYRAHQVRDVLANEELTYASLQELVDQQAENAVAGRIAPFEVDQARQDLLAAEARVLRARADYEAALDGLKLDLGIPVETVVDLDERDLDVLRDTPLGTPAWPVDEGVQNALYRRLDLLVARDREVDACRHVAVARDALGAQFDLVASGGLATPDDRLTDLNSSEPFGSAGVVLDLPLERTAERNAWRAAQIEALRARRAHEAARDEVVFDVRAAYRELARTAKTYEVRVQGVRLAAQRVESTTLLLEQPDTRVQIRDVLSAENDLVSARNEVTGIRIEHALLMLRLESDLGMLAVAADGHWQPSAAVSRPAETATAPALPPSGAEVVGGGAVAAPVPPPAR